MLDREQITNWPGVPASYTVTDDGLIVSKNGMAVLAVRPDVFPSDLIRLGNQL